MVKLGVQRQEERGIVHGRPASGGQPEVVEESTVAPDASPPARRDQGPVGGALEKVTAFVPSEVIGFYVAGLGILTPATSEGKWWMFAICLVLIPVLMALTYLAQTRRAEAGTPPFRLWLILVAFAIVAFVAWTAALPATPFLDFTPRATVIAGVAVLILAVLMYRVADLLDIVPRSTS